MVQSTVQTPVQTTYLVQTVYTTTQPQYSTVTYYSSSQWQNWQQTTTTYVTAPVATSFSTVVTPAVVVVTATSAVGATGVYVTVQAVGSQASRVIAEDWYLLKAFVALFFVCGMLL